MKIANYPLTSDINQNDKIPVSIYDEQSNSYILKNTTINDIINNSTSLEARLYNKLECNTSFHYTDHNNSESLNECIIPGIYGVKQENTYEGYLIVTNYGELNTKYLQRIFTIDYREYVRKGVYNKDTEKVEWEEWATPQVSNMNATEPGYTLDAIVGKYLHDNKLNGKVLGTTINANLNGVYIINITSNAVPGYIYKGGLLIAISGTTTCMQTVIHNGVIYSRVARQSNNYNDAWSNIILNSIVNALIPYQLKVDALFEYKVDENGGTYAIDNRNTIILCNGNGKTIDLDCLCPDGTEVIIKNKNAILVYITAGISGTIDGIDRGTDTGVPLELSGPYALCRLVAYQGNWLITAFTGQPDQP